MPLAVKNDRNEHIDEVKRCVFQWLEAARRRAWDETSLIDESLRQLGVSVRFREPMIIDPTERRPTRKRRSRA